MNQKQIKIRKMSMVRACAKFFEMTEAQVRAEADSATIQELGELCKQFMIEQAADREPLLRLVG